MHGNSALASTEKSKKKSDTCAVIVHILPFYVYSIVQMKTRRLVHPITAVSNGKRKTNWTLDIYTVFIVYIYTACSQNLHIIIVAYYVYRAVVYIYIYII